MKFIGKRKGLHPDRLRSLRVVRSGISMLILVFLTAFQLVAAGTAGMQPRTVSGTVLDENGGPLIGASIVVKGTTAGTISDAGGQFSITVEDPSAVLVISSVGYSTMEVAVGEQTEITVNMQVDLIGLDEVVVIGYGTVKKSDLTGSVSSLKSDDFQPGALASADELLMGRAAGVQVIQNSSEPGGAMSIRVRGASSINAGNEPLYVVDGLPIDNSQTTTATGNDIPGTNTPRNPLATLNPSDIASIEVLKDASATAIYGARGANGVIMITTRKGSLGKMKVSYNGYYGTQSPAKKIDMLNAEEYQQVLNDILDDGGGNPEERVTEIVNGGTDWQDEVLRNAPVQSHNLSMAGGSEDTRYYVSLNYFDQQGIVVSSGIKRYDARINLDHQVGEKFRTGISFTPSFIKDDFVSYGYAINEQSGVVYTAINFDPSLPVKDDNGVYTISPYITIDNPLALAYGEENDQVAYRTMGTMYGEYFILPGWSVKLNLGVDYQSKRRDAFVGSLTKTGSGAGGKASVISGNRSNYLVEATTNYSRVLGDIHGINILAGFTAQQFINTSMESYSQGFSQEITKTNALQAGNPSLFDMYTNKNSNSLKSYIGRVNYTLMDRYLVTATIRADGSSRFGENNKWGYFPSVALAWKMSEESFIQNVDAISNMKFRASWGRTGNQDIGNYQSLTTFVTGTDATFDQSLFTSYAPSRVGNPDLKWETTEQINVGLDVGFLRNRIFATVDWYHKNTFDMLLYLPVPASTGFTSILQNIGSIKNSGFEFLLNTTNLTGDLKWNTSLNFTTLRNEVTDLGPIPEIIHFTVGWSEQIAIIEVGQPMNSFYGYKILGVWQEGDDFGATTDPVAAGDTKYEDLNGDGTVNADDRQILGNSFPDFTWGMNNTFTFKGFDLSIFLEGVHGLEMFNNNKVDTYFPINFRRNKYAEPYLNRWTPDNPTNDYPSFVNPNGQGNKAVNSWTVEDASYVKIRNVKLGYTFNVNSLRWLQAANVYVSGQNLVTWTDYDGFDPANNSFGGAVPKIDYNSYPVARTWIVGVNVTF